MLSASALAGVLALEAANSLSTTGYGGNNGSSSNGDARGGGGVSNGQQRLQQQAGSGDGRSSPQPPYSAPAKQGGYQSTNFHNTSFPARSPSAVPAAGQVAAALAAGHSSSGNGRGVSPARTSHHGGGGGSLHHAGSGGAGAAAAPPTNLHSFQALTAAFGTPQPAPKVVDKNDILSKVCGTGVPWA